MTFPTTGNLAPHFVDLLRIKGEVAELNRQATAIINDIRPALIGQRVVRFGRVYQICQVDVRRNAQPTCYGVTVSREGKVGSRGFDLGALEDCEFLS